MTLILSYICPYYTIQVSDRLITSSGQVFDDISNKNIVLVARNAVVTIGYTGSAYLKGEPTDQWLAGQLGSFSFTDTPFGFRPRTGITVKHLGDILKNLCDNLNNIVSGISYPKKIELMIAGWEVVRRKQRPVFYNIYYNSVSRTFNLSLLERYWYYQRGLNGEPMTCLVMLPAQFPQNELSALSHSLRGKSAEQAQTILAEKIREVSRRVPQVGGDCMSIIIPPTTANPVETRYLSQLVRSHNIDLQDRTYKVNAAYNPWIITPSCVIAPTISTMNMEILYRGLRIIIHGFTDAQPTRIQYIGRQPRKPFP